MARDPRSLLIAEIGSVTTHVTLVDLVEGEYRLVGRAEVFSTLERPAEDALLAVLAGAEQIGESTARELLRDGRLLMPRNDEGDGVDECVAVASAAGTLSLVITAVASDISARSAQQAARCTYTSVLQVISLDDQRRDLADSDATWIERQVQALVGLQPDVVVMAGGLENGADDVLVRLARIVALTSQRSVVDEAGQARQEANKRTVIFAGNSLVGERVVEALAERGDPIMVENLRPTLDTINLEPVRQELTRLYEQRILPNLPGYGSLQRLCARPVSTVVAAQSLITRYTALRNQRNVLTVDVGSSTTACYLFSQQRFSPVIVAGCGTGYGAGAVLHQRGTELIGRWLPFSISDEDLCHWVLNKLLRPHVQPTSRRDLLIEHALAREALALALEQLRDERGDAPYDLLIAGGGVLAHAPQLGLTALTLLDGLLPGGIENELAIDLRLDSLSLVTACGALARSRPDAAIQLYERDGLQNAPLATCVVALGAGRDGEQALEVELRTGGALPQQLVVNHGEIIRLPLEQGRRAELIIRPAAGVRIGRAAEGQEVRSEVAGIVGSTLGVIVDARGRPLHLPEDAVERRQRIWRWLVALGVEQGESPYRESASPRRIVFADSPLAAAPTVDAEPDSAAKHPGAQTDNADGGLTDDLQKLRQTVQEEPKRGWFRRK